MARERLIAYAAEQADAGGDEREQALDELGVEVHARGGSYDASQYG